MKEPRGSGDGALSQQRVPAGHQGLLSSSELTIQGMLRTLVVRELFASARVCLEERERRKRENRVAVVNKTLKLKQEGIRGQVCSHGSWQLTKQFFSLRKVSKTNFYCSVSHPTRTAALMILVFVTNQKPINLAE